jgi:23S rRNA pseudouridine2605 synthase
MSSRSTSRKPESTGERVQKVLANAGIASRREIDRLIRAGRIVIDGRPAIPGDRLFASEKVLIDGKPVKFPAIDSNPSGDVLVYHKPLGEITARRDPEGRKTVFAALPKPPRGRWITIGRLDLNSSGLLLFTTDGELAHRLMHPSFEIEREYAVRIRGQLTDNQLAQLCTGIALDDGMARFEQIDAMGGGNTNCWYQVRLNEGRNREIRRMFEAIGSTVSRLMRIRYGPVVLGRMKRGSFRLLNDKERAQLYAAVGARAPSD